MPGLPRWLAAVLQGVGCPALPAAIAGLCIALYAGQLGLGRWQSDEFMLFTSLRAHGWTALLPRLVYSPRPFSETVLFLYGTAVLKHGRPLIEPFLAVLWAGVIGTAVMAAHQVLPPSRSRLAVALALVLTLFAFVLATNAVTEVFYWPMAAAAYLPTAGACVVLMFLLARPLDRARRAGCGLALLVAAASSEMGAVLAIGFAGAALLEALLRARPGWPGVRAALREGAWWLWPGLLGLLVMAIIVLVRASVPRLGAEEQPYGGHLAASLRAALPQLALALVGGGDAAPAAVLRACLAKLLFAASFALVWRQADQDGAPSGRWHAVLAAGIGLTALFSIVAAYVHYGDLCCQRQSTTRFWLIDLLAILAMRWALGLWWPPHRDRLRRWAWLPPLLLALSLFPMLSRTGGLMQDYTNRNFAANGRARTWRSGERTGTDRMEFYLPPDGPGMLIQGTSLPIDTYRIGPAAPELINAIGGFFGKTTVATCQPWQTDRPWIINGQFFPACPPP